MRNQSIDYNVGNVPGLSTLIFLIQAVSVVLLIIGLVFGKIPARKGKDENENNEENFIICV